MFNSALAWIILQNWIFQVFADDGTITVFLIKLSPWQSGVKHHHLAHYFNNKVHFNEVLKCILLIRGICVPWVSCYAVLCYYMQSSVTWWSAVQNLVNYAFCYVLAVYDDGHDGGVVEAEVEGPCAGPCMASLVQGVCRCMTVWKRCMRVWWNVFIACMAGWGQGMYFPLL